MFISVISVLSAVWRLLLSLLLGMLLTACGPNRYLSMSPVGWGSTPVSDLISHPDSVYVRFHFVRAEDQELVFEAEFSNAANHSVTIDPAQFYFLPLPDSAANRPAYLGLAPSRYQASDPETRLSLLTVHRDEQAEKAEKVSLFEILTMVVNTAEDIKSIGKDETAAQEEARDIAHQNDRISFDNERAGHADEAQALHAQATTMASALLRRATLQPGDRAVGLVYFPRLDAARQLRFVLAFNGQPVPFDFTQELRKLNH
ncbi:hypothetical protein [Hymenobacter psychrophilus]|uniref:Uncharacterized protein n=1 Tax=Hymenobacter psychrophilus TaxID=651662 RepID=A0A1H3BD78_9BACT|nr:hypothetical protein [Hymenobacter psychrophilus]SDX39591.1 hypothetical protein SAMN04488069_101241 [Hymenobacter psychrophilus]